MWDQRSKPSGRGTRGVPAREDGTNAPPPQIPRQLPQRESGHLQDAHPSRKRLAHTLHQLVGLRTREDDHASLFRLVDNVLDLTEELRHKLYLVDCGGIAVDRKERHGVPRRETPCTVVVERDVGVPIGKALPEERGLANLPCPRKEDDLALVHPREQRPLYLSGNIHAVPSARLWKDDSM